jgi:hypothetical protein
MVKKRLIIVFCALTLITVVVLLNSFLFSVSHVGVFCYNYPIDTYNDGAAELSDTDRAVAEEILTLSNIKKGNNIFFISEKKALQKINEGMRDVRAVDVERIFPDRVRIYFVKIAPVFAAERGDGTFTLLDNDLNVYELNAAADSVSLDAGLEETDGFGGARRPLVRLTLKSEILNTGEKQQVRLSAANELAALVNLTRALDLLDYRDNDLVRFVSSIDLSDFNSPEWVITLNMRRAEGKGTVSYSVLDASKRLLDKMRSAVSHYEACFLDGSIPSLPSHNTVTELKDGRILIESA